MRNVQQFLIGTAVAVAATVLPLAAQAASTWSAAGCIDACSENGGAPTVSYSAFTATINQYTSGNKVGQYASTGNFTNATLGDYGSYGMGVSTTKVDTGTPNHSMDNFGYQDLILLTFSDVVKLTELKLGWFQYDSDITVLAYTGDTTKVNAADTIKGQTAGSLLSTGGWELVGSYADIGTGKTTINNSANPYASSWWIVTAYNSQLGGAATGTVGSTNKLTLGKGSSSYTGYDFVKLYSVGGEKVVKTPPPNSNVPEPASLALSAVALLGLVGMRRRQQGKASQG